MNPGAIRQALTSRPVVLLTTYAVLAVYLATTAGAPLLSVIVLAAAFLGGILIAAGEEYIRYSRALQAAAAQAARMADHLAQWEAHEAARAEAREQRDLEREIERADHEARMEAIRTRGVDPGPSAQVVAIQRRRDEARAHGRHAAAS